MSMTPETLRMDDPKDCGNIIDQAASVLKSGGLIVYPTDTSYGIACDPRIETAVTKLIEVKQRNPDLGLPLLFSELSQCEKYHDFGSLEKVLARLFWPGQLTLVVHAKESVPRIVSGKRESIAVRIPDHIIPRGVAESIGAPIVGTSANRSGGPSPFNISVAIEQLGDDVDLYIDGGPSQSESNSTIVGVEEEEDGKRHIKVYREGELSIERLTESLKVDADALRFWTSRIVYADM